MKLNFAGGARTDEGPVSDTAFVLYSENVRWRNGRPETLDLTTKLVRPDGSHIVIPLQDPDATVWNDRELVFVGTGDQLWVYRYSDLSIVNLPAPEAGTSGRWWFAYTEEEIFCARSSLDAKVQVVDRATLGIRTLPNAPVGALCGGISNGVLVLAGTTSYITEIGGDNPPPAELTVRWSARRTDPSSSGTSAGPFGFEDWVPSDINSSGENLLDSGQTIIGGGPTQFGFIVWTDAATFLEVPRTDILVFTQDRISTFGLYASGTWEVEGSVVYWLDNSRTINEYQGGPVRQLENPLTMASTELMEDRLDSAVFARNARYPEIMLMYTTPLGVRRELTYNVTGGEWYPFRRDWLDFTERKGQSPAISIDSLGGLYQHSLREAVTTEYIYPPNVPQAQSMAAEDSVEVEPFHFFITTNYIVAEAALRDGPRNMNAILSHTYGTDPDATNTPTDDNITIQIDSMDKAARDGALVTTDSVTFGVGTQGGDFRGGGKAMQVTVYGVAIKTFLRFGDLILDTIEGARR